MTQPASTRERILESRLKGYGPFIGPSTGVLGLWVLWRAGFPILATVVLIAFLTFNALYTAVELRSAALAWRGWSRTAFNGPAVLALFTLLGGIEGSWVLALPCVFGVHGTSTPRQARWNHTFLLTAVALGMLFAGAPWVSVATQIAGLGLITMAAERLERPLMERTITLLDREADLRASNLRLQHALETRRSFLNTLSHEVRTPMNGILGVAQLLQETALDAEQAELVEILEQSGGGLLNLLNDVLDMSELQAARLELEPEPTDVRAVVHTVCARARQSRLRGGVELIVDLDDAIPSELFVDPRRLRQLTWNLVDNACKFTHQGQVVVRLGWSGHRLWVEVEDTGLGIAEEDLDQLFEPFVQLDGSTTREYGGTGLGLAISLHLTELMGGTMAVHSAPGEGSRFVFEIEAPECPGLQERIAS